MNRFVEGLTYFSEILYKINNTLNFFRATTLYASYKLSILATCHITLHTAGKTNGP